MRLARVGLGPYGKRYELIIESVPVWALVTSAVADKACVLSLHVFCRPREWMFHLGWGRDEDGDIKHSLGGLLWDIGQRLMGLDITHAKREYVQPLTLREVDRSFPDARMRDYEEDLEEPRSTTASSLTFPTVITSTVTGDIHFKAS